MCWWEYNERQHPFYMHEHVSFSPHKEDSRCVTHKSTTAGITKIEHVAKFILYKKQSRKT